jgi:hypothetical protein
MRDVLLVCWEESRIMEKEERNWKKGLRQMDFCDFG